MIDPIDSLLDQAIAYAERRVGDPSFIDFKYKFPRNKQIPYEQISDDKHDLVEMRVGDGQRGMYAKCDMKAGTRLVISQPIAVYWDVENNDGVHDSKGDDNDDDDYDDDDYYDDEPRPASDVVASCSRRDPRLEGASFQDEDGQWDYAADHYYLKQLKEKDELEAKKKKEEGQTQTASSSDEKKSVSNDSSCNRDTKREGELILRVLKKIAASPSIWQSTLAKLYPRDMATTARLPPWVCKDAATSLEVEKQILDLRQLSLFGSSEYNEITCREIAVVLPLIIRYNAFSIETSSELFVYPDLNEHGLESLAGVGLYGPELSYFNHSCTPNVSRYSIGDVMFTICNRDVARGHELCHSYISHEYLCENGETRCAILANDFRLETSHEHERPTKRIKGGSVQTSDMICVSPFILSKRSGCMFSGITRAAKVLPLTTQYRTLCSKGRPTKRRD